MIVDCPSQAASATVLEFTIVFGYGVAAPNTQRGQREPEKSGKLTRVGDEAACTTHHVQAHPRGVALGDLVDHGEAFFVELERLRKLLHRSVGLGGGCAFDERGDQRQLDGTLATLWIDDGASQSAECDRLEVVGVEFDAVDARPLRSARALLR